MFEEIDKYLIKKLDVEGMPDHSLLSKLGHLHEDFKQVKKILEGAEPPQKNTQLSKKEWTKVRREKLYYLNNLLTEWRTLTKKWGMYTPKSISSAYHLVKKLKELRKELKVGDGTGSTHGSDAPTKPEDEESSSTKVSETYRWSSRFVDPDKVYGLDDKAMSLERALVGTRRAAGDSFKAIGIVGMVGIGKTTLAQLIFSRGKVKDYFLPRIWVCMSKQPDQDSLETKEIVERILRSLGVEEEIIMMTYKRRQLEGLIFALRVQLMDKRYLIVLDDVEDNFGKLDSSGSSVQSREVMKQLEYGLPKGCGGTVIMTSRKEKVAKDMVGEENLHTMVPLSDPDSCWSIFKDWVKKDKTQFPQNLEIFKDEIVRKCGGLPLSAKMSGQIVNQSLHHPPLRSANQQAGQQPQTENQQLTEQPLIEQPEKPQPTELEMEKPQPQLEDQQSIEKLPQTEMENQELTEQPENQQLTEKPQKGTENQQPQPENDQPTEEPKTKNQQQLGQQQETEEQKTKE